MILLCLMQLATAQIVLNLANYRNVSSTQVQYMLEATFGSPGQSFALLVDTAHTVQKHAVDLAAG